MSTAMHDVQHHDSQAPQSGDQPGGAIDPVCGMQVRLDAPDSVTYQDTPYRFCSRKCADAFRMEPLTPSTTAGESSELADMARRLWVGLALTLPLVLLAMGSMIPGFDPDAAIEGRAVGMGLPQLMGTTWSQCLQALLATPVVLWAGWPFLERGWRSFRTWQLNMFSLIGIGVSAAYFFSLYALFLPKSDARRQGRSGYAARSHRPDGERGWTHARPHPEAGRSGVGLVCAGGTGHRRGSVCGLGTGTDIAMNSARVVLVKGDLRRIARARLLSQGTMRNIRQNLFFAFIYNFLGVPIAAGVLHPWFGLLLSPIIASAAMALSSVSVIANALRLRTATI